MPTPVLLDHARLADDLRALAHESRLDILETLREPRALADIRVAPGRVLPGENPDRAMSRQAVQDHVEKLVAAGLVVEEQRERRSRTYAMNQQRLYQILEALHAAAGSMPDGSVRGAGTVDLDAPPPTRPPPGPRLALAHGLREGRTFPLQPADLRAGRGWIVGRRPGLHVSLEYDPYVSLENSEIRQEDGAFHLHDLPESKNGTSLNWTRLPRGGRARLAPGDVVGVGRSLLVFQA